MAAHVNLVIKDQPLPEIYMYIDDYAKVVLLASRSWRAPFGGNLFLRAKLGSSSRQ
jgi:hypothetical protein